MDYEDSRMRTAIFRHPGFTAAAAGLLLAAMVPNASASLILELDDLSTVGVDITVIDDSSAGTLSSGGGITSNTDDGFVGAGTINFSGSVGNFIINVTTGISKPVIGPARIDLNSVNVSSNAAGLFEIRLTDTDFGPTTGASLNLGIGGTTDGTITAFAFGDEANGEFGVGGGGIFSTAAMGPGPFSATASGTIGASLAHSLSLAIIVDHSSGAGQISSFNAEVAVPEPTSLGLLGMGLLGLGWAGRKHGRARAG